MTWRGKRRRTAGGAAAPRKPARRGAYVVRHRLRVGSLLSGALLVGGLCSLAFAVLALPWMIAEGVRTADSASDWLAGAFAMLLALGLPALVALIAGLRQGNAALRRRVLAMDDEGIWEYTSARWRHPPHLVPWHQAGPVRAYTESETAEGQDPLLGPVLVPWDHVRFGEPPRADVHVLWLTATVEEIVAEARRRCPGLVVRDERLPAPRGLFGWVLRRRRRTRRRLFRRGRGRT